MMFTRIAFLFSLIFASHVLANASQELGIDQVYVPEHCPTKTKVGDQLQMHYTGTLLDGGEEFDSSVRRGTPFSFKRRSNCRVLFDVMKMLRALHA
jgi:hypothetical protein